MRVVSAIAVVVFLWVPAAGADDDPQARARAHSEIGAGMYRLGDYHGALREFAAGFELTHKTGFLLNLGQTYRKLRDLTSAREMYRKFLTDAPAEDPQRKQAEQVLAAIERELRDSPPPLQQLPPPPSSTPDEPRGVPSPAPTAVVAVAVVATPPRRRPHNRALEISGIVLGLVGVGLVGGGAGAAVAGNHLADDLNSLDRNQGNFRSDQR